MCWEEKNYKVKWWHHIKEDNLAADQSVWCCWIILGFIFNVSDFVHSNVTVFPVRMDVFAQVTTSYVLGRRPPQGSPATKLSESCRDVVVTWPCWLPENLRVRSQQLHHLLHLQTLLLCPPYPLGSLICPHSAPSLYHNIGSARPWEAVFEFFFSISCWLLVDVSFYFLFMIYKFLLMFLLLFSQTWKDMRSMKFH